MESRKALSTSAAALTLIALALIIAPAAAVAAGKITIGAVEDVALLPWNVKIPARVDTGAATSSIDVCEVAVRGRTVHFTLADRCGGRRLTLPLLETRHIQTPEGGESRPVVEMEICLGSRKIRTQVTLNDRSRLEFPFLIGRNILEGTYIVDVSLSRTALARCPSPLPLPTGEEAR